MYFALKGKITHIIDNNIVICVNDISYQILVTHLDDFKIGEIIYLYIKQIINENEQYLIGFKTLEEKKFFLILTNIHGIGPKTAINILNVTTPKELFLAIDNNDIVFLKKLPKIGLKMAKQILFNLKDFINDNKNKKNENEKIKLIKKNLINLGFSSKEIKQILLNVEINDNCNSDEILKKILKQYGKKFIK